MGSTPRQRETQQQEQPPAGFYYELALALAAAAAASTGGTALVVGALVNLGIPEFSARRIAPTVIESVPVVEGTTGLLRFARIEQIIYRALYAIEAARRHAQGVDAATEERYLGLHLGANAKREDAAAKTIRAIERWGELVSWNATIRPTNRPNHRQAHRKNWRPADGIPLLTGALPGALPFCLCYLGPPIVGAEVLAA